MLGQQRFESVQRIVLDLMRIADRLRVSVGIALFIRDELAEEIGEKSQDLGSAWRAETDRVGQAVVDGNAAVSQTSRHSKLR